MPEAETRTEGGRAAQLSASARRAMLIAALLYPAGLAFYLNLIAPESDSVAIDFVAFWAAAKLAVQGSAVAAFDWARLVVEQRLPASAEGAYFGWHYPPGFHLLIAPLGWLSFTPAFAVYTVCAVAAYVAALRPWGRSAPVARNLAFASPAVFSVVFTGNTSLLWGAAFLAAMHGLARGRPFQAGLCIALLTMKPQLGILIPLALLAGRHWGAILWASLVTLLIAALATAVFGIEYWRMFFHMMALTSQTYVHEPSLSRTMVTWYAFLRQFGIGHGIAFLVQMAFSVAALVAVALLWVRREASLDLKIAALLLATLTATAYAYQYELVLATLAVLFLARDGLGTTPAGRTWLALIWLLPLPGRLLPGIEVAHYAAPVLAASLAAVSLRALRPARG